MNRAKNINLIGLIGAIMLIVGVFCPVIDMPFEGSVSFINKWIGSGILIMLMGFGGAFLSFFEKSKYLWLPSFLAIGILLYQLYDLNQKLDQYSFGSKFLKSNLKSLMSLEWGWVLLFGAAILSLISSFLSIKYKKE